MTNENEVNEEGTGVPEIVQEIRDELVKIMSAYELAAQAQARALSELATVVLRTELQLLQARGDIELMKQGGNNE